jgi:hypothetical protein
MFKIPAPLQHHNADGLVITSTLSIASAGIWRKASAMFKALEGRPSIKNEHYRYLLNLHFPISTETEGTLPNTSLTVPPLTSMSFYIVYFFIEFNLDSRFLCTNNYFI